MYEYSIDEANAVLLGIYSGTRQEEDIERFANSHQRVDAIARVQHRGALFVVVPDSEYPSPRARDRMRFAQLKDAALGSPSLLILVTKSAIVRSVVTAVSWLSPQHEGWRTIACDSFMEAMARAEQFRPSSGSSLRAMERNIRARLQVRQAG
jgi:hypothetical protein